MGEVSVSREAFNELYVSCAYMYLLDDHAQRCSGRLAVLATSTDVIHRQGPCLYDEWDSHLYCANVIFAKFFKCLFISSYGNAI